MELKYITFIFCLILFFSCGDETKKTDKDIETKPNQKEKTISKTAIENFKYRDYTLSNDAKKEVAEWSRFQELETQISFLKQADITFFTTEKDTLKAFLDSMRVSIPKNINTNPINARISVLETKLLKLNNDLALDNYAIEKQLKSIKDLLIANSYLIFGINKKLEFDENDVGNPENFQN